MAAIAKKLTLQQRSRAEEIQRVRVRLLQRDLNALNREIVQSRLDAINRSWSEIRRTHFDLIARTDAESIAYVNDGIYAQMEEAYEAAHDEVVTLLLRFETPQAAVVVTPPTPIAPSEDAASDSNPREAKLPKLDLPTFSGKHEDWENFCDLFTSLVHNVTRLSDATKFQYLKTCLKDSATDLVKDIFVTNANYLSTWQTLKARYSNPGLTVNNYLTTLLDLPYLQTESANELRALIDKAQSVVRALTNLKLPVSAWDIWFVHILVKRLDPESRKLWETEVSIKVRKTAVMAAANTANEPEILEYFKPYTEFIEFIEQRIQALTMIANDAPTSKPSTSGGKKTTKSTTSVSGKRGAHVGVIQTDGKDKKPANKCPLCSRQHNLWSCPKFLAKNPYERRDAARRLRLCFLCLVAHDYRSCTSKRTCSKCQRRHNTMLHTELPPKFGSGDARPSSSGVTEEQNKAASTELQTSSDVRIHTASCALPSRRVLLATAQVLVVAPNGLQCRATALLDQGSEASFLSESLVQALRIATKRVQIPLSGIGATSLGCSKFTASVTLCSLQNPQAKFNTAAYVLPKLTNRLPSRRVTTLHNDHLVGLKLADPRFFEPKQIDLIVGAEVYAQLLRPGLQRLKNSALVAQETALGWIISGPLEGETPRRAAQSDQDTRNYHVAIQGTQQVDLENELQRFWMVEEVSPPKTRLDPLNEACEKLFAETHSRGSDDRYMVHLPLLAEPPRVAAETRNIALRSLRYMHGRFAKDPKLATAYIEFMRAYEDLGHMERVPIEDLNNPRAWYIPHHAACRIFLINGDYG